MRSTPNDKVARADRPPIEGAWNGMFGRVWYTIITDIYPPDERREGDWDGALACSNSALVRATSDPLRAYPCRNEMNAHGSSFVQCYMPKSDMYITSLFLDFHNRSRHQE